MICPFTTCRHLAQCEASEGCLDAHLQRGLAEQAAWLVNNARDQGMLVEIELQSVPPLAMRNTVPVVTVRRAR